MFPLSLPIYNFIWSPKFLETTIVCGKKGRERKLDLYTQGQAQKNKKLRSVRVTCYDENQVELTQRA